ncbi:MAG: PEP-CTERM sorting domain-containing protein [Coleofasciculus sp. A1-SPW-01]|uniref:PEP-CTERM sorting domain-containing protein n=1 Tax=Coleofasciculus sp. A1-SPW-01 TaxID=3070819 RepID=UPI0032F18027
MNIIDSKKWVWCIGIGLIIQSYSAQAVSITVVPASRLTGTTNCHPDFRPPQCESRPFDNPNNVALQGGIVPEAVAFDIIESVPARPETNFSGIHRPEFANDGLYGNGSSWISDSPHSWLKLDLGRVMNIDRLTFGRDRLGGFDDRDPGQFIVEVAISENVYANGDDSNDSMDYTEIVDSELLGFGGFIAGSHTIQVSFDPVVARYVKLTFENRGTAIDEVEVSATPVPEPLTILGSITALALGTLLKQKYSRQKEN